jgi:hypothetical protein
MNVHEFNLLYREQVFAAGITGSTIIMAMERVRPGTIRVITHVSVQNETSDFTECSLSVRNGISEYEIDQAIYPGANELLKHHHDILLGEGDILQATLTGTVTGDQIKLTAIGWEISRRR